MKVVFAWFTCSKDLPLLRLALDSARRAALPGMEHKHCLIVSPEDAEKVFHPQKNALGEDIAILEGAFPRGVGLEGFPACQAILEAFLQIHDNLKPDYIIKIDSDCLVYDLSFLAAAQAIGADFLGPWNEVKVDDNDHCLSFASGGVYVLSKKLAQSLSGHNLASSLRRWDAFHDWHFSQKQWPEDQTITSYLHALADVGMFVETTPSQRLLFTRYNYEQHRRNQLPADDIRQIATRVHVMEFRDHRRLGWLPNLDERQALAQATMTHFHHTLTEPPVESLDDLIATVDPGRGAQPISLQ